MKKLLASLILLIMAMNILPADSSMSDGVSVEYIPPAYNLGIGYISPTAKLHVNGDILAKGTLTVNGSVASKGMTINGALSVKNLNVSNGGTINGAGLISTMFGTWRGLQLNRVYRAPTDGFANMKIYGSDVSFTHTSLIGYTDSSDPPTEIRAGAHYVYAYGISSTGYYSSLMPVRKGDYFSVIEAGQLSSGNTESNNAQNLTKQVEWLSIGSSSLPAANSLIPRDILIENSVTAADYEQRSPSLVFISSLIGYMFFEYSDSKAYYKKTTNGGLTWGTKVLVSANTNSLGLTVWYDRWTPGDTTGTKIHILCPISATNLQYLQLDTGNSDSLSISATIVANAGYGATIRSSIVKSTDGTLYATASAATTRVVSCPSNLACTTGSNWAVTETSTAHYPFYTSHSDNDIKLVPLASAKILALWWDTQTNNQIKYSVYTPTNASASRWSAATVLGSAVDNLFWRSPWGATINKITGEVYLCYNDKVHDVTGSIKTVVFSNAGAVTSSVSVPDSLDARQYQCDLAYDELNDKVVLLRNVTYNAGSNVNQIFMQTSSDGMQTWSAEAKVNLSNRDYRQIGLNHSSDSIIYAWYLDDANDDVFGNRLQELNMDSDGWQLAYSEDFEARPTGWSNNTTSQCGGSRILAGYGVLSAATTVSKTFDLSNLAPHTQVKIRFSYYSVDSWDAEIGYLQIADVDVWNTGALTYNDSWRTHICGNTSWLDNAISSEFTTNHSAGTIKIGFRFNGNNEASTDESFGVDNLEVWVK